MQLQQLELRRSVWHVLLTTDLTFHLPLHSAQALSSGASHHVDFTDAVGLGGLVTNRGGMPSHPGRTNDTSTMPHRQTHNGYDRLKTEQNSLSDLFLGYSQPCSLGDSS